MLMNTRILMILISGLLASSVNFSNTNANAQDLGGDTDLGAEPAPVVAPAPAPAPVAVPTADPSIASSFKIAELVISGFALDLLREYAAAGQKAMAAAWNNAISSGKMASWEAIDPATGYRLRGEIRPGQSGTHKFFKTPCTEFKERAELPGGRGWRSIDRVLCHIPNNGKYEPSSPSEVDFPVIPSRFPIKPPSPVVFLDGEVSSLCEILASQTSVFAQQIELGKQVNLWLAGSKKLTVLQAVLVLSEFAGDSSRLEALKAIKSLALSSTDSEENKVVELFVGPWYRKAALAILADN